LGPVTSTPPSFRIDLTTAIHGDDEQAGTHIGEKAMPEMTMTLSVSLAARTAALIAEQQQKIAALEAPHRLVPLARSVDPDMADSSLANSFSSAAYEQPLGN
jgi:hypothetical protein